MHGNKVHVVETVPTEPSALPTVVLIAGLGGAAHDWCAVQRLLPPHVRSISYDRFGIGSTPPIDGPRSAAQLARELSQLLEAAEIPKPYLLVLHSFAGIIGREYLELDDEAVAGIVYVDANQEQTQTERRWPIDAWLRVVLGGNVNTLDATRLSQSHQCTADEWSEVLKAEAHKKTIANAGGDPSAGEWSTYEQSLLDLGKHRQLDRQALGLRPLSVIMANLARDFQLCLDAAKAAGHGTPEDHEVIQDFCDRLPDVELRMNSQVLKLSSVHRMVMTSVSGHLVNYWEPELVVQEILWCLGRTTST